MGVGSNEHSRLLRGRDLHDAETWLNQKPTGRERAIPLQREFIAASRRATTRRRLALTGSAAGVALALGVAAFLAADFYVANLNSRVREAVDKETNEAVFSAQRESARAVAVCRYMPLRSTECDAAYVNLGIAERASQNLEGSLAALSRLIDEFSNAGPRSEAEWVSLATAYWERAVTTIAFAEAAAFAIESSLTG